MPKELFSNDTLVLVGGLLLVYFLIQYSGSKNNVVGAEPSAHVKKSSEPQNVDNSMAPPVPVETPDNTPQDLLPHDSNSEWSEFAPQGQGDLLGSGSLLNPELSQRPYNSVQGANALRGDPQISIGDIPSIATPANPIQSNNAGIN